MSTIFMSYRRHDARAVSEQLYRDLSDVFGKTKVFRDSNTLMPGLDFTQEITKHIQSAKVMIVLIGHHWLTDSDPTGLHNLDSPTDYVRREILAGIAQDIPIIPVLIDGAKMPSAQELPPDLLQLERCQAFEITTTRWKYDVSQLIQQLESLLGTTWQKGASSLVGVGSGLATAVGINSAILPVILAPATLTVPIWGAAVAVATAVGYGSYKLSQKVLKSI